MTKERQQLLRELLSELRSDCLHWCETNPQGLRSECLVKLISRVSYNIGFLEAFLDALQRRTPAEGA